MLGWIMPPPLVMAPRVEEWDEDERLYRSNVRRPNGASGERGNASKMRDVEKKHGSKQNIPCPLDFDRGSDGDYQHATQHILIPDLNAEQT